jgi:ABC-type glycerol-3-phosphate transport system permease component
MKVNKRKLSKAFINLFTHIILIIVVLLSIIPLIYMVSVSLKPNGTEFDVRFTFFGPRVAWENYYKSFTAVPVFRFLLNTLFIVITTLIGETMVSSFVAYGFARFNFPAKKILFSILLATMMIPFYVIMIPLFVVYSKLKWINTFLPLIVPSFAGTAFYIFLLRQFYMSIPRDLDDAARIDGASYFRIWWNILLPLTSSVLATVAILSIVAHWNDFTGPLIILNSNSKSTLSLGLRLFRDQYTVRFNLTMAYAVMITAPMVTIFFIFQKYFIKGIIMSGLTGR